jgi:hypothetical protein
MNTKIFLSVLLLLQVSIGYGQTLIFENSPITVEKWNETQLVIPIEIEIDNNTAAAITSTLTLTINNARALAASQLSAADVAKVSIRNNSFPISLNSGKTIMKTSYLVLDKTLLLTSSKVLYVDASIGAITNSVQINLQQPNDLPYTLSDYLDNDDLYLDKVQKVESANNILTIYGEKNNGFQKRSVALRKGEVYAVWDKKYITNFRHLNFLEAFSIFAVPYKVRPENKVQIKGKDTTFPKSATSGLTNVGLNLEMAKLQVDRYFSNGKKSTHKLSAGLFVAPTVEELDSISTKAYLKKDIKSKQLFLSTGLTISYSYNDISLVFVPFGWDFSTSTIGKNWIYDGRRWWGFGIGVSPKIFSTILNK